MTSYILVGIQFALIGFLAWHGGVPDGAFPSAFFVLAAAIGVWAVATMRFRFNVLPDVRPNQTLYTGGPYAFVRHPMYTAVLLVTLGFAINRPDLVALITWLALMADLRIKLGYEEQALTQRFQEYASYAARTKRLIPFVY